MNHAAPPLIIGWKEYLDLPDWGVRRLKVKIDTGAKTSALDVASCELRSDPQRGMMALLRLALRPKRVKLLEVPVLRTVVVRNSGGVPELRPLIETVIRLGEVTKQVQLTVTNRSSMRFRMILGRQALAEDFLVDVSRKYLLGRQ